jgi:predicted  nucleic acid-binding Zn-ribbon protein
MANGVIHSSFSPRVTNRVYKECRATAGCTSLRLRTTAGELADAQIQIEWFREQPATLRQEIADLMAARAALADRLVAERDRTEYQRHRAEAAEQHASRGQRPS